MASKFLKDRIARIRVERYMWRLDPHDLVGLSTWPAERAKMITILEGHVTLPTVLCDIVVAYLGSSYADILISLGTCYDLAASISRIRDGIDVRQSTRCIKHILINATGAYKCTYPNKAIRDAIRKLPGRTESRAVYLETCAIFHHILLTYFSLKA